MTDELDVCLECDGGWCSQGDYPPIKCPTCKGTGKYSETGRGSDGFEKCPECGGDGMVDSPHPYIKGSYRKLCPICDGTGKKQDPGLREKIEWFEREGKFLPEYRKVTLSEYILALIGDVRKQERERIMEWSLELCPHSWGKYPNSGSKKGCQRCWEALKEGK